jgi:hypothetical protein
MESSNLSSKSQENYIIFREYIKCVFPPLTEVVDPIMNLISGTHDFYERKKYAFNVLSEYNIIILKVICPTTNIN